MYSVAEPVCASHLRSSLVTNSGPLSGRNVLWNAVLDHDAGQHLDYVAAVNIVYSRKLDTMFCLNVAIFGQKQLPLDTGARTPGHSRPLCPRARRRLTW